MPKFVEEHGYEYHSNPIQDARQAAFSRVPAENGHNNEKRDINLERDAAYFHMERVSLRNTPAIPKPGSSFWSSSSECQINLTGDLSRRCSFGYANAFWTY